MLIRGERIEAVGQSRELRKRAGEGARTIDARGGLVLPGFLDSHIHLLDGGLARHRADLASGTTLEAALSQIATYARTHPQAAWIQGTGWEYGISPSGGMPTRQQLDRAVPDRPAAMDSYDGHAVWLNTRALEKAGISTATPDPAGGRIYREADGRTPQGTLVENALLLAANVMPEPLRAEKLEALAVAMRQLAGLGVTSVDHMARDPGELELFETLRRRGRMPIRVRGCLPLDGDIESYERLRRRYDGPWLRVGLLKGFLDGVVESKTASMLRNFEGSATRGSPQIARDRLLALIRRAHARGFQVGLHCVGDGAVRTALDAFEQVQRDLPGRDLRHRLEHVEVVHPADLPRFRRLGIVPSMQPFHALPDGTNPDTGAWPESLGPGRRFWSFAWRSLSKHGAALAFGSDWNVASPDPLRGLAVAMTRRTAEGLPRGGWNAHQTLDWAGAVGAYTAGAARAMHREAELGRIEPGYYADLVILDAAVDPAAPRTLWTGAVRHVLVAGRAAATGR